MGSYQNKVGSDVENQVAKHFKENKYWAYICPKKIGGQPFDIIACKSNNVWFVDAKHLEFNKASFTFDRIEANQKTSMDYASKFAGITNLGFVIRWERDDSKFFFLPYDKFLDMSANGLKSVKIEELQDFDEVL